MRMFIGIVAATLAAAPVAAKGAAQDAMAFARQVLTWYLNGDAARVWEVAGPSLREIAGDVDGLKGAAAEIDESFGKARTTLDEQMFAHPEGGGAHVYVRTVRHEKAPEIFWIVIFSPAQRSVLTIMPQPRQTIRSVFPQVRLPPAGN